jgi:hypothetical protein
MPVGISRTVVPDKLGVPPPLIIANACPLPGPPIPQAPEEVKPDGQLITGVEDV